MSTLELTENMLDELQKRCIKALEHVRGFAAPWIIEFSGLPRAGKSECISIIEHLLRRNNFKVLAPSEGAMHAPEYLKASLTEYNAWTAMYAIKQILEGYYFGKPDRHYDIVLLDRGLFDATAWFHYLENDGRLIEDDRKALTGTVRIPAWKNLLKQVFVFFCEPQTSIERELKTKLTKKAGTVFKTPFLNKLKDAYEKAINCYAEDFLIRRINTENKGAQNIAYEVSNLIFDDIDVASQQSGGT
jgi:thymidylate kinase